MSWAEHQADPCVAPVSWSLVAGVLWSCVILYCTQNFNPLLLTFLHVELSPQVARSDRKPKSRKMSQTSQGSSLLPVFTMDFLGSTDIYKVSLNPTKKVHILLEHCRFLLFYHEHDSSIFQKSQVLQLENCRRISD